MTDQERLALTVGVEFDFYLNMAKEGISDRNVRTFITHIVIPRMMSMKAILGHYKETELTWARRRELEATFMKQLEGSSEAEQRIVRPSVEIS